MPHKSTSVPQYEAPKTTSPQSNTKKTTKKQVENKNKTDMRRKEEIAVQG
jgi:hypothetical protein